jgi:hypothetical protein
MASPLEIFFVILGMSLWILFPIGMFLSVAHLDKNSDQLVRLDHLRNGSIEEERTLIKKVSPKHSWRPHMPAFMRRLRHH